MKHALALLSAELALVKDIMKQYPNTVVFGSRVKGTQKKYSDLDLAIKDPITGYNYVLLQEAFEESDLPFTVDLVEYDRCDDYFKQIIDQYGTKLSDSIPLDVSDCTI